MPNAGNVNCNREPLGTSTEKFIWSLRRVATPAKGSARSSDEWCSAAMTGTLSTAVSDNGPVAAVFAETVTPAWGPSIPSIGSVKPRTVASTCDAVGKASSTVSLR